MATMAMALAKNMAPSSALTFNTPPLHLLLPLPFHTPCPQLPRLVRHQTYFVLDGTPPSKAPAAVAMDNLEGSDTIMDIDESNSFVEVGWIRGSHGVKGEVKVTSRTDFPEERFEKPGIRWIGFNHKGRFVGVREVELTRGRRIIQGKEPTWLLTFQGFDTLEEASELLGAAVLVKDDNRPTLNAEQFYIPELIGMSVQLKESGQVIGSIVDVFNGGASDLLRVKLLPSCQSIYGQVETGESDIFAWIPFAEEIVPIVDRQSRKVEIVPPKGLLELNFPSNKPLKQEKRKEALKSKRKLQERLSGVKKSVLALKQEHILVGLTHGDEDMKEALKAQLLGIDFKLFKQAAETAFKATKACDITHFLDNEIVHSPDWKNLEEYVSTPLNELKYSDNINRWTWDMWRRGLELVSENRVAVVVFPSQELIRNDIIEQPLKSSLQYQMQQVSLIQELAEMISGEKCVIPLVVATSEELEAQMKTILHDESYFGLLEKQVIIIKSTRLPLISHDAKEESYKIPLESQWNILTAPAGEGQVIMDLDDSGVLNDLVEMGVEYVHVSSGKPAVKKVDPVIFGIMNESDAHIALRVTSGLLQEDHGILCLEDDNLERGARRTKKSSTNDTNSPGNYCVVKPNVVENAEFNVVRDSKAVFRVPSICTYTYSIEYLQQLSKQRYGFVYESVPTKVSRIDGECFDATSDGNKYFQLKCSLNSALLFSPPSKVALIHCDSAYSSR